MLTVRIRRCSDLDSFQLKLTEQLALLRIAHAVCLFGLMLGQRSTAEVMPGRSVILSTLFLGKPPRGR